MHWCLCGHLSPERNNRLGSAGAITLESSKYYHVMLSSAAYTFASQPVESNLKEFIIDNSDVDYPLFTSQWCRVLESDQSKDIKYVNHNAHNDSRYIIPLT